MPLARFAHDIEVATHHQGRVQPGLVERILVAIREHLGMDVAFTSKVSDGQMVVQHANSGSATLLDVGDRFPAEETYCQRIIDGRLPYLIPDTALVPEAARLPFTRDKRVGAHISVPLRLSDGSVHGTFCSFSHTPDPTLNRRDLQILKAFADVAAGQIEAELDEAEQREAAIRRIVEVIERDRVGISLQPIHGLDPLAIIGVEALARFPGDDHRPPCAWFAEAREVGHGVELELAAVRAALRALPYVPRDVYLAINASPETLIDPAFLAEFETIPPGRIVIEITEHALVDDYGQLKQALATLRPKARIAIDDAGAGYSGLRHILAIEPDIIKLDMSLTRDIDRDSARAALASALVRFGRDIGCQIIAEGVESAGELDALHALGVDAAQGRFLHSPMPIAVAAQLFAARAA